MTTEELERLLAQQPVSRLHRLAHGRIHRHFRLGKRRLIEALLRHSAEHRAGLESDLSILIQERPTPTGRPELPHKTDKPLSKATHHHGPIQDGEGPEPPTDLTAFLAGIGVPPPQP